MSHNTNNIHNHTVSDKGSYSPPFCRIRVGAGIMRQQILWDTLMSRWIITIFLSISLLYVVNMLCNYGLKYLTHVCSACARLKSTVFHNCQCLIIGQLDVFCLFSTTYYYRAFSAREQTCVNLLIPPFWCTCTAVVLVQEWYFVRW